jgi:hypothetical protein
MTWARAATFPDRHQRVHLASPCTPLPVDEFLTGFAPEEICFAGIWNIAAKEGNSHGKFKH